MVDWFNDTLGWMYWTAPSAIAFGGLFLMIIGLGIRDHFSPSYARKGFLPMATTRGDRLFIGVLIIIAIHVCWILFFKDARLYPATGIAALSFACVGRWG